MRHIYFLTIKAQIIIFIELKIVNNVDYVPSIYFTEVHRLTKKIANGNRKKMQT